jgi:hypothetical protein
MSPSKAFSRENSRVSRPHQFLPRVATAPAYAAPGTEHEWQCGKVNVKTYLSESPSEYIIPSFHMKYVVTGIEKANNRFDLNGDGLYLDGKLCWPIKPLTCLRPDGTEEPCDKRPPCATRTLSSFKVRQLLISFRRDSLPLSQW